MKQKTNTIDYTGITKACERLLAFNRAPITSIDEADLTLMQMRDNVIILAPDVEADALKLAPDDPIRVRALLGIAEARRQLTITPTGLPLYSVVARAERLARCARALVKHHDALNAALKA